jgi:RNA polymerase sigma-70 factor (ECF subfamily)
MLQLNETVIIQKCLSGQTEEYRHLVEMHETMLLRTAYHYFGNWEDAKDAAQEAFIKAYHSLHRFQQNKRFGTWIYRILVNVCKDRLRSAQRRLNVTLNSNSNETNDENRLNRLAEKELIQTALKQLPRKRRMALILVDIVGFSYKETSHILSCSESTIRVTLMKARQQLRNAYTSLNET